MVMFLFEHRINDLKSDHFSYSPITLMDRLTGEVPSRRMLVELLVLVLLLHVWVMMRLLEATEPVKPAQPLMMEVSMIPAPHQRTEAAPVKPPEPPRREPPKLKKKKAKAPKPSKQETILVPEARATASAADDSPPTPAPFATAVKKPSDSASQPFTEANFRANYGFNPKPEYPRLARSRHWQGKVLLRVQVSADGQSERVTVFHGSGHDILDESAVAAVEKWRFIPAMRGTTPVASSVIVPVIFTLNN